MSDNIQKSKSLSNEANDAFDKGDFKYAITLFRKAVDLNPSVAGWHAKLGYAHLQNDDRSAALECFKSAIELNPDVLAWRVAISEMERQEKRGLVSLEATSDYYNEVYENSEKYRGPGAGGVYEPVWSRIIDVLKAFPSNSVLDVGCGPGQFAEYLLSSSSVQYTGIDFSSIAIANANAKNLPASFICDDALSSDLLPLPTYDTIICTEVLEHLTLDLDLLQRFPSKVFAICSVPNYVSFGHVRIFSNQCEIRDRYGNFFEELSIEEIPISGQKAIFLFYGSTA